MVVVNMEFIKKGVFKTFEKNMDFPIFFMFFFYDYARVNNEKLQSSLPR